MPKRKHHINRTLAATLIFSGGALVLLAFVLLRIENILGWIGSFLGILRPVFIGIVLTFVLYGPTLKITKLLEKITRGKRFPCHGVAVLLSYVLLIGILVGIICIVVPAFISSIEEFAGKFSSYLTNIQKWLEKIVTNDSNNILQNFNIDTRDIISQISNVASKLPDYVPDIMGKIGQWASGLVSVVSDIGFGVAFSAYMLVGKTRLKRQAKRIIKTFFSQTSYNFISHYSSLIFNTFSSFVSGQLMEALILGLLCFIGMSILGFPYAIMISVIIGVTNIIPIIGPIIGTIPGAIIYLMIDPWKAVWFVIFVIILQQIDSNLIYPRVVGNSIGLPAIWILFAITIGGGLFGIIGMVVCVPLMSVLYTILSEKTAAAAEAEAAENGSEKEKKPPMFPEVEKKTGEIISRFKGAFHRGMNGFMDKIDEYIHRNESKSDSDKPSDKSGSGKESGNQSEDNDSPEDSYTEMEKDLEELADDEIIDKVFDKIEEEED